MTEELKEIGLGVGHRCVGRLMCQNNISVIRTRKHKVTTDSNHKFNIAAFKPGPITSIMASAKTAMRALAKRWLALNEEVLEFDKTLKALIEAKAPSLFEAHGIATMTIAEMLILVGDDPTRIRSEAALAKLCGVFPIPASSSKTRRYRLNRGGNRQANAALYRVAIARMRSHQPTLAYVHKRTKEGKSKSEIIRCLKLYIAREIFRHLCKPKA